MIFTLSILTSLLLLSSFAEAKIKYDKGFHPRSPSSNGNEHAIFVAGDYRGYSIKPLEFDDFHQVSDAVCGKVVPNSYGLGYEGHSLYSGPCATNVKHHDQYFSVQCKDPNDPKKDRSGSFIVRFHPTGKSQITTTSNAWAGFSNEPRGSSLRTGQITSYGKGVGAYLNCYGHSRKPTY